MIGRSSKYENQQKSAVWKKKGRIGGWGAERNEVKTWNSWLYFTKRHFFCFIKHVKNEEKKQPRLDFLGCFESA